jgi:DNA-binding response OmpR family regulator
VTGEKGNEQMNASKPKKILTVDDDEGIRSSISQRLELEGFETVWAKNGRVALDYMKAMRDEDLPDLILLDYQMPIMNGQEFCHEKARTPRFANIPVVMMTAGGNLVNVMDKLQAGADGYMSKPMDDETIVKMVRHFLDQMPDTSSVLAELIAKNPEMLNKTTGDYPETI